MKYTMGDIGKLIRRRGRNSASLKKRSPSPPELACGSLSIGKENETCEMGKALTGFRMLGIKMTLTPPAAAQPGPGDGPHA